MINPYQPPQDQGESYSLLFRVRKGVVRAVAAYRKGLRDDGFTTWQHIRAWFALLVTLLLISILFLIALLFTLHQIGWLD